MIPDSPMERALYCDKAISNAEFISHPIYPEYYDVGFFSLAGIERINSYDEVICILEKFNLILKQNSYLFIITPYSLFEIIYNCICQTSFEPEKIPLVWHEKGFPDTLPYSHIIVATKGEPVRVWKDRPFVISTLSTPLGIHPDLYLELIHRVCLPGYSLVENNSDGMLGVAVEKILATQSLNPTYTLFQKDKKKREQAIANLFNGYKLIVEGK